MFNTKRGISIYLAVMIMAILLAMVLGLNAILVGQIKTIRNMGYSVTAFYAAETGIEQALYDNRSAYDLDYLLSDLLGNGSQYTALLLGGGESNCPSGVTYCVESIGIFQGTRRAIQVSR